MPATTTTETLERRWGAPRVRKQRVLEWATGRIERCEVCGAPATLIVRRYERPDAPNTAADLESRYFCDKHEREADRCYLDLAAKDPPQGWDICEQTVRVGEAVKRGSDLDDRLRGYIERNLKAFLDDGWLIDVPTNIADLRAMKRVDVKDDHEGTAPVRIYIGSVRIRLVRRK